MTGIRTLIVCLALGTAITLCADEESAAPEAAAIQNGGFEKGIRGWQVFKNARDLKISFDKETKTEGRQALRVSKQTGVPIDVVRQDVRIPTGGAKVRVSAMVKAQDAKNGWFKFFAYDATENVTVQDVDLLHITGTFDWKKVERTYELPANTTAAEVKLLMVLGGTVWIDDVQVEIFE